MQNSRASRGEIAEVCCDIRAVIARSFDRFDGWNYVQHNRIGGLHPSPIFGGEGGAKRRVGVTRAWTKQPPTRHTVRFAHDVPPSPQEWEGKERASFARLDSAREQDV